MADIELPVVGGDKNEWGGKVNDALSAINDEQETGRLSEASLSATIGAQAGSLGYTGTYIGAVGDSITSADGSAPSDDTVPGGAHHVRAALASNGRMLWIGAKANGGNTVEDIVTGRIPEFIAAFPQASACIVLAGTNNMGDLAVVANVDRPAWIAAKVAILNTGYDALLAAGIRPIAATIPPRDNAPTYNAAGDWWNREIARNANARGFDLLDYHGVLTDPATGSYQSGLKLDDTHPNPLGHKKMGEYAAAKLSSRFPARTPLLLRSPIDPLDALVGVGLFNTDTNADGVADGWTAANTTGCTLSRIQDADGNWWQQLSVPDTATSSGPTLQRVITGAAIGDKGSRGMLVGDTILISGRMKINGADAFAALSSGGNPSGPQVTVTAEALGSPARVILAGPARLRADATGEITFERRFKIPVNANMPTGGLRISMSVARPPSVGTIVGSWAQLCVQNLTAFGLS